ncbi:MAG TPA: P-loop NTPase [Bryobacteraceae bacterium]|nr:P-loop NTPase [Bryobacteraceae bacterium]
MSAFTGILITPDSTLQAELEKVLSRIPAFELARHDRRHYPNRREMRSLLNVHRPSVIFIDIADIPRALEAAKEASQHDPEIQFVAIGKQLEAESMLTAMQAGMREFLAPPLTVDETREALNRLRQTCEKRLVASEPTGNVFCFLPSKPGVGATTVCLNTAMALAARPGAKVALLEFDLCGGTLDFMLHLEAGYSVRDAAEYGDQMNAVIWERLISKSGRLDVLRAGKPDPDRMPAAAGLAALIRYARRNYSFVCIDLPGAAEGASREALRAANRILLVASPEIASVHMAVRSINLLKEQGLEERLALVVNRTNALAQMNRYQMEELLGQEVIMTLPNYYSVLQRALALGHSVIRDGVLGKRFAEFAEILTNPGVTKRRHSGFLSYWNRWATHKSLHNICYRRCCAEPALPTAAAVAFRISGHRGVNFIWHTGRHGRVGRTLTRGTQAGHGALPVTPAAPRTE